MHGGRRARLLSALLVSGLALTGTAHAVTPAPGSAAGLTYLSVAPAPGGGNSATARIVDEAGRDVLLRGVNVTGLQDDRVDSGALESGVSYPVDPAGYVNGCPRDDPRVEAVVLCSGDADQLRDQGYDVVRLALNWSLLEPTEGQISSTYLDRIAQVVGWFAADGIRTVLDMHSDGWSRYLEAPAGTVCPPGLNPDHGQDGAPAWATDSTTVPPCEAIDSSLDPAVEYNAQRLYSNVDGLQDHYVALFSALAARFGNDPAVAGYEVQNEPLPGVAPVAALPAELLQLDARVVAAMQTAHPGFRQLVFIEPEAERNTTGLPQVAAPWSLYSSYPDVVYAPHVYTGVFTKDDISYDQDYADTVTDAHTLGLPLWIGEFGGPPGSDPDLTDQHYAHQDADLIGSSMWDWKDNHTGSGGWSVYVQPFDPTATGTPNTRRKLLAARAYPEATAGTLLSFDESASAGSFALTATSAAVTDRAHATVVALPANFPGMPIVTGATFQTVPRGSGREVVLLPTGGTYSLRLGPGVAGPVAAVPSRKLVAKKPAAKTPAAARHRAQAAQPGRTLAFTGADPLAPVAACLLLATAGLIRRRRQGDRV